MEISLWKLTPKAYYGTGSVLNALHWLTHYIPSTILVDKYIYYSHLPPENNEAYNKYLHWYKYTRVVLRFAMTLYKYVAWIESYLLLIAQLVLYKG